MKRLLMIGLVLSLGFTSVAQANVFDLTFESIEGDAMDMSTYKGKTLLVAVTATQCGNTHQFGPLQSMWEKYKDDGLVVVGIPTNDFGLEPRDEAGIKEFCSVNYSADFPMTSLSHIKGEAQHPFFKEVEADLGKDALPAWNFFKYLVNAEGEVVKVYPTPVQPSDPAFISEIEKALGL